MLDDVAGTTHRPYANLRGKRILVVEDEAVIAVDYYFQLRAVGAQPQAYLPTIKATLDYLAAHDDIDGAIVDTGLRDGHCEPVLELLVARSIPFVVVSGYSDVVHSDLIAPSLVLSKPVGRDEVWCALSDAFRMMDRTLDLFQCGSARVRDADRRSKLLKTLNQGGSFFDADAPQLFSSF